MTVTVTVNSRGRRPLDHHVAWRRKRIGCNLSGIAHHFYRVGDLKAGVQRVSMSVCEAELPIEHCTESIEKQGRAERA